MNNEKLLDPVRPNLGLQAEYARALKKLVDDMHNSVMYWLSTAYRNNEPHMAADNLTFSRIGVQPLDGAGDAGTPLDNSALSIEGVPAHNVTLALALDESPTAALMAAIRRLRRRWLRNFDKAAKKLSKFFAQKVSTRSDAELRRILKDAGITIEFKMTRAQNDVFQSIVQENVSLIRSIPQQYLNQVEVLTMQSVQAGRDLGFLAKEIEQRYGVTRKRAALIARDQNNKATASLNRARQVELGITEAIWVHSTAGKTPRKSHLKAGRDKVRYNVKEGWYDPDAKQFIIPGQLINCRCISRSVIPGFVK